MILTKSNIESADLDFEISRIITSGQMERLLLIVPTNRKIRYQKKEIISAVPSKAASKINLETIGTFSSKLFFRDHRFSGRILSEAAASVLIKQSFREIKPKYFSAYNNEIPSGTLERIRNVISEYKRHGITPAKLKAESKNLKGAEKLKAEDISAVYSAYQEKCEELQVKEIGDIYSGLINLSPIGFNEMFRELFPEADLIVINGFDEFTGPEIDIIDLLSLVSNCSLFISFDYYNYNPLIFSHLDKCYSKLEQMGFKEIQDKSATGDDKFISMIKENLFNKKKKVPVVEFKDSLVKITARNREAEIILVAKEIKNLIIDQKIEPNKICVVFNLIQKYSPVIRDIFSLYGIPFNLTDRFLLSNSPPVISLINFLEIPENDYFYKNILRALSSGYLNIKGIDLSSLLKASVDLKILSGFERWTAALQDAIAAGYDSEGDERASVKTYAYNKALSSLKILNALLKPFTGKLTIKEFHELLYDLMFKLELPVKVVNDSNSSIEKNIKALNTFTVTVDEVLGLFEEEYGEEMKFSLHFFLNHIRTAVSSARYNIKEKPGYGVQITTLNEIRGLKFDYLFICGLCDGDLPTRYMPEIFLSGSYFKYEQSHQTEERYHFYQALCSWNKKLYLTFPSSEETKELVQSNFLTEFQNLFEINRKDESDYANVIYSKDELLKKIGLLGPSFISKYFKTDDSGIDPESIERFIQINYERINENKDNSSYAGYIYDSLSDEEKELLEQYRHKQFSVSQLETYAKCPYKYFAERVLRLEGIEEPSEEVEALEMGGILHNILFEFYKRLREDRIVLHKCTDEQFQYAQDLIFTIAGKKVEEANFKSPLSFFEREKILGINNNRKNSILYKFLLKEKEEEKGFIPEFLKSASAKWQTIKFLMKSRT
jgi:ATP-dependent helicase/nuclease subunit B